MSSCRVSGLFIQALFCILGLLVIHFFKAFFVFPMAQFQLLDHLMNLAGTSNLHDRMRLWFVQESGEESALGNLLFVCCEHLRRVMAKNRIMMVDLEVFSNRGVGMDCLDALRKTQNRHKVMLELLTDLLAQVNAAFHEEESNAVKMNENN